MKNEYSITYEENGKKTTIITYEDEKTLKQRLKCYKENDIKIINVFKKVIVTKYIEYLDY